jgi:MFS family permease
MQAGDMSISNALTVSRPAATAFVVIGMFWGCFAAYVPVIKAQLGASDALFGTLLLGSATGLVSAMWLAPYADRFFGARGMQVGAAMLAVAWLLPGQMTNPWLFAVTMAFVGLASGMLDVVMNARVSELEAQHAKPLMNVNHAMFSVAYAVGAILVSFTREAGLGPTPVFAGFAVLAFLMLPLMRLEVAVVPSEDGYSGAYPIWPILLCGGIILVAFMSEATVEAWSALHVERTLGGGAAEGALGPAMLGITMAIGRFSGQAVAERVSDLTMLIATGNNRCRDRGFGTCADRGLRGLWCIGAGRVCDRADWTCACGASCGAAFTHRSNQPHGGDGLCGLLYRARVDGWFVRSVWPARSIPWGRGSAILCDTAVLDRQEATGTQPHLRSRKKAVAINATAFHIL